MFFFLSKIIVFLLEPATYIFLIALILLVFSKLSRRRRVLGTIAFLALYLPSTAYVSNQLMRYLERLGNTPKIHDSYDAVLVLSGIVNTERSHSDYIDFGDGVERIIVGTQLMKKGVANWLILSGGSGALTGMKISEAPILKAFAIEQGVPESAILLDDSSRNTFENAINSTKIAKSRGLKRLLVVTSAFHAYRAKGCFFKQGMNVDLHQVDFHGSATGFRFAAFLPSVGSLEKSSLVLHEFVGIFSYKILGKASYDWP